jgi:choline dehydrogenase
MPLEADRHFDVVVVGSGSSGGVVAARLSEDESRRVLLLEAGPDFPAEAEVPPLFVVSGEQVSEPAGVPEFDWGSSTQVGSRRRQVRVPRGRLVGGSSMVNGTVATRGAPAAYDEWAGRGNPGWSWTELLPYFKRIETDAEYGSQPYHGDQGPIWIRRYRPPTWTAVANIFMEACLGTGFAEAPDLNAPDSVAGVVGPWPVNRLNNVRLGTLVTYLRQARGRSNLVIRPGALVDRVLLRDRRAVGVRYVTDGRAEEVEADLVVLSGGAYGTPPILQRSGIGPEALLRRHDVPVVADLPVGLHLSDHPGCTFLMHAPGLSDLSGHSRAACCRGPEERAGEGPGWQTWAGPVDEREGTAMMYVTLTHQDSEGTVEVGGQDPSAPVVIDHRFQEAGADLGRFRAGLAFCRELLATRSFARFAAREVTGHLSLDEVADAGLMPGYHATGTCRMGHPEEGGVVDHELRVHGIDGLRVADASVIAADIQFNPNLTCYVVGEVAADLISSSAGSDGAGGWR